MPQNSLFHVWSYQFVSHGRNPKALLSFSQLFTTQGVTPLYKILTRIMYLSVYVWVNKHRPTLLYSRILIICRNNYPWWESNLRYQKRTGLRQRVLSGPILGTACRSCFVCQRRTHSTIACPKLIHEYKILLYNTCVVGAGASLTFVFAL